MLSATMPPNDSCVSFTELMQVMSTLADSAPDKGHVFLFKAATEWIEIWYETLSMNVDVKLMKCFIAKND